MLDLKYELLFEVVGEVEEPIHIGQTPRGYRVITPLVGGTVKGPKINGEALAIGADWMLIRPDGYGELDVRSTIKTDDGETIYSYYKGLLKIDMEIMARIQNNEEVDPSEYYFRTTPTFETGSEKYGWLNQIVSVGVGKLGNKKVCYKTYHIL